MKKCILFRLFLSVILILSIFLIAGCSNKITQATIIDSKDAGAKIVVAVTIVPEQTFVEAVCGDLAQVVTMVPPGSSPENYEPSPQEMILLSEASVYFSIGVPTEMANILPQIGDIPLVSLQDEVAAVYPDRTFKSGERDPHIWLSPKRVEIMIEVIVKEMCSIDEVNADTYTQNGAEYIAQLEKADKEISETLKNVDSKKFIVYHPAFGYFADDYGLEMYALEEEGKEATVGRLEDMIDLAKEENIKVIFYQEEIDSSQAEAFAQEIGGVTEQLAPLSADYINNLNKIADTFAETL